MMQVTLAFNEITRKKNTHTHTHTKSPLMSHKLTSDHAFYMPPTLKYPFGPDKLARLYLIFGGEFTPFWRSHH